MAGKSISRSMRCVLWLACGLPGLATAQQLIRTQVESPADHAALGSQYRDTLAESARYLRTDQPAEAIALLGPVLAYCDSQQQRQNLRFVSVSSQAQYERYLASRGADTTPVEWLDMACTRAYFGVGYALVEQRRFAEALPYLDKAAALAPYFPDAVNERGGALNQLHRHEEALASYRQVLALAEAEPSAAYMVPLAWRGIGYALIEQQDWDGARQAYEYSLTLDPDNPTALSELTYIRQRAPRP